MYIMLLIISLRKYFAEVPGVIFFLILDLVKLTTVTASKMKAHCVLDQGNDSEHSMK